MKTLKDTIQNILLTKPETRDSDKKLIWKIWTELGLIKTRMNGYSVDDIITEEDFMKAPSPESIRRCRQALQRSDLLLGKNLIQPTPKVKEKRHELSKEKGFSYIAGKLPVWNPEKQTYETN